MNNIKVSIIIVNYNTLHVILPCIDSIIKYTKGISYEIIVVDNDSTDGSQEILAEDKRILFLPTGKNLGFGKANNYGLTKAHGQYIFFLNSDTILRNNAIKLMYDFAQQYEDKLGALGGILEDREGNPTHSYGKFPKMGDDIDKLIWIPIKKGLHLYNKKTDVLPDTWMKVEYITGADLFVKREVLEECGAFHPSFFMYCEEAEMEYRFHQKGYENIILNGPRIIHLEGESSKNTMKSKFIREWRYQQKSEYIYFKLTEPRWKYYLYRIIHPILRQTLWLNPNVSFTDKWRVIKQLFVKIKL